MDARKLARLRADLTAFLDDVTASFGHPRQRHWCDAYVRGVLLDGHRKSVEPMAARLKAIERGDGDYEQALQQFLSQSPWDEQALVDDLQTWIGGRFGTAGFLIIDDTGLPKQGEHSVGVARQYTGTLGKVASCQVAVTLRLATAAHVVALDARLYLPQAWTDDPGRTAKAGVPDGVGYQPKWQMALAMVRRAGANGFRGVVLADSLFGTVTAFREQLDADGRAYCVGIDSTLKVVAADADLGPVPPRPRTGRPPTRPASVRRGATSPSVRQWAVERAKDSRSVTGGRGPRARWPAGSPLGGCGRPTSCRPGRCRSPRAGCWPSGRRGRTGRRSTSSAIYRRGPARGDWWRRPRAGGGWSTATAN